MAGYDAILSPCGRAAAGLARCDRSRALGNADLDDGFPLALDQWTMVLGAEGWGAGPIRRIERGYRGRQAGSPHAAFMARGAS